MQKKLAAILIPVVLIAIIAITALIGKKKTEYTNTGISVSNSGFYFDTVVTITLYGETDSGLIDACFDKCAEYEALLSRTAEESDVWKINHAQGRAVEVDERTAWLISEALTYSKLTDGLFDISIASASTLWDFSDQNNDLPDSALLREALAHIDYTKIDLSRSPDDASKWTVKLGDPDMMIDLGGIAKGYIADQLTAFLKDKGVKHAIINLGGNVAVIGSRPDGSDFNIGIQYPFKAEGEVIAAASLSNASMVTSGGYERYIEKDGRIFHHILDPETGYAVDSDILSVSICCSSSVRADALSTSVFLLGYDKGKKLIEDQRDVSALIITKDLKLHPVGDFPLKEIQ